MFRYGASKLLLFAAALATTACNGGGNGDAVRNVDNVDKISYTLDAERGSHAYIGQFILAEPDVEDFTEKTGHTPPIVTFMADWIPDDKLKRWVKKTKGNIPLADFKTSAQDTASRLYKNGSIAAIGWSIPLVHWDIKPKHVSKAPNVPAIINGEFDEFIATFAKQVKDFGKPILITFLPEFNNHGESSFGADGFKSFDDNDVKSLTAEYGDPELPDGPERVRDAVKHVIDLFKREGANNVSWFMYGTTQYMVPDDDAGQWWNHPRYYYPGDEYIDWVGKSLHFSTMSEFVNYFEPGYTAWGEVTQNPVFLPELSFHQSKTSRTALFEEIFDRYLPYRIRFKAATFYHSPIGEKIGLDFGTPLGGKKGKFEDEIKQWKQGVSDNKFYRKSLLGDKEILILK